MHDIGTFMYKGAICNLKLNNRIDSNENRPYSVRNNKQIHSTMKYRSKWFDIDLVDSEFRMLYVTFSGFKMPYLPWGHL